MRRRRINRLAWAALLFGGALHASDYRSIAETGTILYSGPSATSTKLFIVSRYYPVEVVMTEKEWTRVRDAGGQMAWVPSAKLSERRFVVVTRSGAALRRSPDPAAPTVLIAEKDVALELVEAPSSGWIKVRHDGRTEGYISLQDVWGI